MSLAGGDAITGQKLQALWHQNPGRKLDDLQRFSTGWYHLCETASILNCGHPPTTAQGQPIRFWEQLKREPRNKIWIVDIPPRHTLVPSNRRLALYEKWAPRVDPQWPTKVRALRDNLPLTSERIRLLLQEVSRFQPLPIDHPARAPPHYVPAVVSRILDHFFNGKRLLSLPEGTVIIGMGSAAWWKSEMQTVLGRHGNHEEDAEAYQSQAHDRLETAEIGFVRSR